MKNRTPASLRGSKQSDRLNSGASQSSGEDASFTMSDLFSGLANITKQVSSTLNSYEIRKLGDKVQGYVLNFTEVELKVREATNEDPWGPTGPQIQEIAQLTNQYDAFPEVMGMLWKRMLQDTKLAWRRVYKSLMLLQGLLKLGNDRCIANAKDHLFEMRALESYKCVDERGRDQGVNNDELMFEERRKARGENKEKYQGFSKEDMLMRGGSGGSKFSSFESWNEKKFTSSKSTDFELPEPKSSREVTAFDFDDGRRRSASPELGIPDHSQRNVPPDDDDFGDFADARSNQTGPASAYNTLGLTRASDPFGAPKLVAPSALRTPRPPSGPSSPVANNEPSLLDLDFGPPVQANPAQAINNSSANRQQPFDLFAEVSAAQLTSEPPKPQHDFFGDFAAAAPQLVSTNTNNPNNLDSLFGFDSAPNSTPVAQPNQLMQPPNGLNNGFQAQKTESKPDAWSLMQQQLDLMTLGQSEKKSPSMNEMMRR